MHASSSLDFATVALARGDGERAVVLAAPFTSWRDDARVQARGVGVWARALVALTEGRRGDAAAECLAALADVQLIQAPEAVEVLLEVGGEAAWTARDAPVLRQLIATTETAPHQASSTTAKRLLQRARLAVLDGDGDPTPEFATAIDALREIADPYWLATALLEYAEWLTATEQPNQLPPLLAEARDVFERLRTQPRLERIDALETASARRATRAT